MILNGTFFFKQKEPIKLPKEPVVEVPVVQLEPDPQPERQSEPQRFEEIPPPIVQQQQPDVIPLQRESAPPPEITLPPPAAFENAPNDLPSKSIESNRSSASVPVPVVEEQIYSNINYEQSADTSNSANGQTTQANDVEQYVTALVGNEQHDLSEYIEDTGYKAIALYDYEATADDEISFDPNDIITHIEKVRFNFVVSYLRNDFNHFVFFVHSIQIDEGWWRGLCKNRYGLFPANYVQLQ